jgi:hypothetical protein
MTVVIKANADKDTIKKALGALKHKGRLNAYEFLGCIKIKENPLDIQKKLRDEW